METFGKFVLSFLLGAVVIISQAWAVVILWRWFAVPYFHVAPLTWQMAYGFILILSVMHQTEGPEHEDKSYTGIISRMIGAGIFAPWVAVGVGWLIK